MIVSTFKSILAAFANRDQSLFQVGNPPVDLLLTAMNNSIKWAQRTIDFELCRVNVDVSVDLLNGADLSTAVLHGSRVDDGTGTNTLTAGTPVSVNKIERAFLPVNNTLSWQPCDFISRNSQVRQQQMVNDHYTYNISRSTEPYNLSVASPNPAVIRYGNTIYVWPGNNGNAGPFAGTNPITVGLDVVQWLPDFVNPTDTNFLMDNCQDWLMYRTLAELNFFLKASDRFAITDKMLADSWQSVVDWNGSLEDMGDDVSNLD